MKEDISRQGAKPQRKTAEEKGKKSRETIPCFSFLLSSWRLCAFA
jgi:hypothetical protein